MSLSGERILLIIGGGIAAYKSLDLIRRLRERGAAVRCVMTRAAQEFITPLSVGALSADHVFTDLFDRNDEHDVGHIRLSREADLIVVAPATADLMAKLANGLANDLASTVLLASDKPVLLAPAMNPKMWAHPATKRNRAVLEKDGVKFVGPARGEMAESGEAGEGRMSEPLEIVAAIEAALGKRGQTKGPLAGRKIIVTSGPTHEPIDPVRYIANRSSGKQGHALAAALAKLGADVRLVSGPVAIADPAGVTVTHVETARQMQAEVEALLPADAAVFVAAVADWRTEERSRREDQEGRRRGSACAEDGGEPRHPGRHRPPQAAAISGGRFCGGDAGPGEERRRQAEEEGCGFYRGERCEPCAFYLPLDGGGRAARRRGRGWQGLAPTPATASPTLPTLGEGKVAGGVMGGERNRVKIVSKTGIEAWPEMSKAEVAERLAALIAERLKTVEV